MRTLDPIELRGIPHLLTDEDTRCDYVYSYPPRQAYRDFGPNIRPLALLQESIRQDSRLNLYVHFPFCSQICSFCNLYATARTGQSEHESYVELLDTEIRARAAALPGVEVRTVYFGGGTPSLLRPDLLQHVMRSLEAAFKFSIADVGEVALEVSPHTASEEYLAGIRSVGFSRVNLGVQSTTPEEIHSIGRRYASNTNTLAMEAALLAGFDNVCVDLIYGLPGQTMSSWTSALDAVTRQGPETICAYPLTVREGTRYGRLRYVPDTRMQFAMYDVVADVLTRAGYVQETHVRWALPGKGGYLQKEYHWAGENVLGFGAGARSYVRGADLRNGYSVLHRTRALEQYGERIRDGIEPATAGFLMDADERRRKGAVLGLMHLDLARFESLHGVGFDEVFTREYQILREAGLVDARAGVIRLTPLGVRHRDVIVQLFFSPRVASLVSEYSYAE